MQGKELKAIRHELGLSAVELGRALGYAGTDNSASVTIRRYEANLRPIPPLVDRLAKMFARHGCPPDWTVKGDCSL